MQNAEKATAAAKRQAVVDSPKQRAVPVPNQQHAPCHRTDVVARTTDKPSPNMLGFNWPLAWLKDEVFGGGPPNLKNR